MALDDKPWWGKKHSLYGGETFTSKDNKPKIGIATGDRFRVEKKGSTITLAPHTNNQGTLRDSNNAKKPIKLTKVTAPLFDRAYSMTVTVTADNKTGPMELFFVERKNSSTAITNKITGGEVTDGTASVER